MSRIDQPPTVPSAPQTPRRAEETDTRQALQRHDPEFYRKKKDDDAEGGFQDPYEDLTDVSVPALKNFLLGLLDRAENAAQTQAGASVSVTESARPPASPQAAAAMQAYKTGGARGGGRPPRPRPCLRRPRRRRWLPKRRKAPRWTARPQGLTVPKCWIWCARWMICMPKA